LRRRGVRRPGRSSWLSWPRPGPGWSLPRGVLRRRRAARFCNRSAYERVGCNCRQISAPNAHDSSRALFPFGPIGARRTAFGIHTAFRHEITRRIAPDADNRDEETLRRSHGRRHRNEDRVDPRRWRHRRDCEARAVRAVLRPEPFAGGSPSISQHRVALGCNG
jgi:hypothetical protein